MDYKQFKENVKENILKYLPEEQGSQVEITSQRKNNGVELHGIFMKGKQKISPVIYLEDYYDDYLKCGSMKVILEQIAGDYREAVRQKPMEEINFQYESVKGQLLVAVCNAEKNQKILEEIPHELHEDLALFCRINIKADGEMKGNVLVTNKLFAEWGIDKQTLMSEAWQCMSKDLPACLISFQHAFGDKMSHNLLSAEADIKEPSMMPNPMYVLTSKESLLGASYMFDPVTMEKIAEKLEGNLIILPSSIHELLILKETEDTDIEELKGWVEEANETAVAEVDFLSGEVYRYDKETATLSIAGHISGQQMGMQM